MRVQIGAYTEDGRLIEDWSQRSGEWLVSSGPHGCDMVSGVVRRSKWERAYWWDRKSAVRVRASAGGRLFEGRLEDTAMIPGGMRVRALGGFRAYTDAPYTALWSSTGYANWEPVTADDHSSYNPELYELDNNNRLYLSPMTSQTYTAATERGGLVCRAPHNGQKKLKAISFTYTMPGGTDWRAELIGYNEGFTSAAVLWTLNASGVTQAGAQVVTLAPAKDFIVLALYRPTLGGVFSADIGSMHIKLTNVRITTTAANMVSTTLGTTIAAGTRTVTPGSMNNIFVGQALTIGGTTTERVLVTAVTATTFSAVFAAGHSNTDTVKALYVSADEIAAELVAFIDSLNDAQASTSTHLIEETGRDLPDAIWEDAYPADILTQLADDHNFEVGVWTDQLLYFRPRGSAARTWYVDASVELERTLEALRNSAYGVYTDDRGRLKRTAVSTDTDSVSEWGITRRASVYGDTSSDDRAEDVRDDYLETAADPTPRAVLAFRRVFSETGVIVPLHEVRAGDYVAVRNVAGSPRFLLSRVEYAPETNTLMVEPLVRPPTVEEALAAGLKGKELSVFALQRTGGDKVRVL